MSAGLERGREAARRAGAHRPEGWARLAALGPLTGPLTGRVCLECGALAVVGTPDGFRCGDHPPQPGPPGLAGWGHALNWRPKGGNPADHETLRRLAAEAGEPEPRFNPCAAGRCYCGRCGHYTDRTTDAGSMGATDLRRQRQAGLGEGRRRRESGTAQATDAAPDWTILAHRALRDLAKSGGPFTADDLIERVGLPRTSEANKNNAVGAAFNGAARAGMIRRTGDTTTSTRPEAHARRIAIWIGV